MSALPPVVATIPLGARPTIPLVVHAPVDRPSADVANAVATLGERIGRLRQLVHPQLLGDAIHDGVRIALQSPSTDITAGTYPDGHIDLGGRQPNWMAVHPASEVGDVAIHEFGHVLWDRMVPRQFSAQWGALSESFGDVLAYASSGGDRLIGEGLGVESSARHLGTDDPQQRAVARAVIQNPTGNMGWGAYELSEYISRAFVYASDDVGMAPVLDAWIAGTQDFGRRLNRVGTVDLLPAFRAATIAAAPTDRVARVIADAWSDSLAPLSPESSHAPTSFK